MFIEWYRVVKVVFVSSKAYMIDKISVIDSGEVGAHFNTADKRER